MRSIKQNEHYISNSYRNGIRSVQRRLAGIIDHNIEFDEDELKGILFALDIISFQVENKILKLNKSKRNSKLKLIEDKDEQ